ncbi:hypothetical protein NDA11_007972 [Ustilago hordei]|nr:hypothetical protein NDA10_003053 [Ustilago hordei]KAJ1591296.1 hypothetical protein NDA11_007972 [Ustilago hordei]KAJ1600674.1 hypothetical protein NDA14_002546 [Ustilago hordei]UTT93082.1 hypothetical protein NDA17_006508 [Ustilago hordei]
MITCVTSFHIRTYRPSVGLDARVVVWDVVRRRVVQVLREHGRFVVKVAFSGSGGYLASIGYDKKVVVYRRTKRTAFAASQGEQEEQEEQEQEPEELQGERYVKVWEKETQTNPESILFIRASPYRA